MFVRLYWMLEEMNMSHMFDSSVSRVSTDIEAFKVCQHEVMRFMQIETLVCSYSFVVARCHEAFFTNMPMFKR